MLMEKQMISTASPGFENKTQTASRMADSEWAGAKYFGKLSFKAGKKKFSFEELEVKIFAVIPAGI